MGFLIFLTDLYKKHKMGKEGRETEQVDNQHITASRQSDSSTVLQAIH